MVARLRRRKTYRIIAHRPYDRPIADRLPSVMHRGALEQLEALTNPRLRQERDARKKIRSEDVGDPPNELVLASFVYSGASRFTDGSFGVYYAALERATAIAESRYHTERFLTSAGMPPTEVFKRVLGATIDGVYEDVRDRPASDPLYDPDPARYAQSQAFALGVYARDESDGIVYRSVRAEDGTCVAAFRPRRISHCTMDETLLFAFDGERIDAILRVETAGL